jgi:hypothetical protein
MIKPDAEFMDYATILDVPPAYNARVTRGNEDLGILNVVGRTGLLLGVIYQEGSFDEVILKEQVVFDDQSSCWLPPGCVERTDQQIRFSNYFSGESIRVSPAGDYLGSGDDSSISAVSVGFDFIATLERLVKESRGELDNHGIQFKFGGGRDFNGDRTRDSAYVDLKSPSNTAGLIIWGSGRADITLRMSAGNDRRELSRLVSQDADVARVYAELVRWTIAAESASFGSN